MKNKTLAKCYIKFFAEFIHHASKQDIIITAALLPIFWRPQNTSAQKLCNVFTLFIDFILQQYQIFLLKSASYKLQQRIKDIYWK